jgi:hypothetical protein
MGESIILFNVQMKVLLAEKLLPFVTLLVRLGLNSDSPNLRTPCSVPILGWSHLDVPESRFTQHL